jgi:type 1 fimbria pilin
MADAAQVRGSVNVWLATKLPLPGATGDKIVFEAETEAAGMEWRVWWDAEQEGQSDQSFTRLVQLDRSRGSGNEMTLEKELAAALRAIGLSSPGATELVPLYSNPGDPSTAIGTATLRRLDGDGWKQIQDPAMRPGQFRATITLQVDYPAD